MISDWLIQSAGDVEEIDTLLNRIKERAAALKPQDFEDLTPEVNF